MFWHSDIAEFLTEFDIIDHRSSGKKDHFIIFDRSIDDLNYSTDIGSKSRDDHPAFTISDDTIQTISNDFF